ncbi:tRNA lysidine(34) synthetase TilS [Candidatus Venteria ishoeyi]|uniref:tRNA lysidine(34) synthetase TilS n=1 Tax=Candidatus Venteria ishoeyi TaxID=1899563 RepID=UPI0025A546D1|nr:tRNA lysidine(34) synthetase TilS [Candidatus Venteria ishoeyi]MDM8546368.1 tRNA lysidine(34) synthetase TilS [Candidatus Venteria ishoeyi]
MKASQSLLLTVQQQLEFLLAEKQVSRLWLAFSGGLDSQVLLHLLAALRENLPPLSAVHIHHGLQTQADAWADNCQQVCLSLKIPCQIVPVVIPQDTGESLEALAREARYQAFAKLLQPAEALVTAQHADDQAETLLLQLFRGAGAAGLAAMPQQAQLGQAWLLRPLLQVRRQQLADWAKQQQLEWIDDPSNQDRRFDRNFLRHEILPSLQQRWPSLVGTLNRAASQQAESWELLQQQGSHDLRHCCGTQAQTLSVKALLKLSHPQRSNALRVWLKQRGFLMPSARKLMQIENNVLQAGSDRQPLVCWSNTEIRRYRDNLYALTPLPRHPPKHKLEWSLNAMPLALPLGQLRASPTTDKGLCLPLNTQLEVRFRRGGECWLRHKQHQSLKNCLQAAGIPPWLRGFLPLLYWQNELIAVPGVGISDKVLSPAGENNWTLQWLKKIPA